MNTTKIIRNGYTVEIEAPTVYVDNKKRRRSGHMTHAMAEFAPNKFIDFNSNCSAVRLDGHSAYGWVEYRISEDSGKTYSAVYELPVSKEHFLDGIYTISVEKAVACDDGSIVAFCLRNSQEQQVCCEPWDTPLVVISTDGGQSWSEPTECIPYAGRIYDALYHKGVIYVMIKCDPHFIGSTPEHVYRLFTSADNGKTFTERCIIPIDGIGRGYGSILIDDNDVLHAYGYNETAETEMDHAISTDFGKTWTLCSPCHLEKGIRNPQTALIDGVYILHGRAMNLQGFVFYSSENGADWDEGYMFVEKPGAPCFYSNNLKLRDEQGEFLLIQYSHPYAPPNDPTVKIPALKMARVNVMHTRLRIKR